MLSWRDFAFSSLTRLILLANLTALAVLVVGVLVLGEMRRGLIEARIDGLRTQGEFIANTIARLATTEEPSLDDATAVEFLRTLYVPATVRVRLFDTEGELIEGADSYLLDDRIVIRELGPVGEASRRVGDWLRGVAFWRDEEEAPVGRTLDEELALALKGRPVAGERRAEDGERVVSVSVPIQRVQAVLGAVTLEAGDVSEIIAAERRALAPFVVVAAIVTVISSILLTVFIARPVRILALAADRVRQEGPRRAAIPDLSARRDEIGDLSVSLAAMTRALTDRIDAIESFAADVAHEIKNPLTSIRSAVETFPSATSDDKRARLLDVMQHDVKRIDRLITDIANASRVDAELSRAEAGPLDLDAFLKQMTDLYAAIRRDGEPEVVYETDPALPHAIVTAAEDALGQVFRNLIDNAKTFSPAGSAVRLGLELRRDKGRQRFAVMVDDQGPGIPAENVEKVFDRFYTDRPEGAAFGSHSGLGLGIARQIVEAHGGRVWAENRTRPDGAIAGARFTVLLPARRP